MSDSVKIRWNRSLIGMVILTIIFGFAGSVAFLLDVFRKGFSKMFSKPPRTVRPNVLISSEFGSHGFVRLRNSRLKLHYVAHGPTDKPLILFVHGFPEFWYSWRFQLKEFSKDYRAVAFDMRGYGDSDKPAGISHYIRDKLVDDIDQLVTELGYEKFILVGHDWGGAVAWSYAALHPDRVERLILANCSHPRAYQTHVKSGLSQLRKSWYRFFFQVPVVPELFVQADDLNFLTAAYCGEKLGARQGTFSAEDLEAYKYTFSSYGDVNGPINFYRAVCRYRSPQVDKAFRRKISVPTLMIWGTNDAVLEKRLAELSGHYVEDYRVHYIEGASHWVQQEEPDQFNAAMRQFLSRRHL